MLVEVKNLSKTFEMFSLNHISFQLPKGYIMGLIGQNGSGKTTLLHTILGLYKQTAGEVLILGKTYEESEKEIRNLTGTVLTEKIFEEELTLEENAEEFGRYFQNYRKELLEDYLEQFSLDKAQLFGTLSTGEMLKFQFAFAMAHQPKLLILDEPTGNFDPKFRMQFWEILKEFIADGEKSVILATHLTDDLDQIADYILYLEDGNVLFWNDIETLRQEFCIVAGDEEKIKLLPKEFQTDFKEEYDAGEVYLLAASSALPETANEWVEEIKEAFPGMDVLYDDLSFGISCHTGPDALGIGCVCKVKREK